jgi:hypothetical protein
VRQVVLLALDDEGAPRLDQSSASVLAGMGIPVFACTPDLFPEMMAAAISREDVRQWAAAHDIVCAR